MGSPASSSSNTTSGTPPRQRGERGGVPEGEGSFLPSLTLTTLSLLSKCSFDRLNSGRGQSLCGTPSLSGRGHGPCQTASMRCWPHVPGPHALGSFAFWLLMPWHLQWSLEWRPPCPELPPERVTFLASPVPSERLFPQWALLTEWWDSTCSQTRLWHRPHTRSCQGARGRPCACD